MRIIPSTIIFCFLISTNASADTIYFKNGQQYKNASTKETDQGIWIDGVLFDKKEIDKIEKAAVVKEKVTNVKKTGFTEKVKSVFDKTKSNVATSIKESENALDNRIKERIFKEKMRAKEEDAKESQKISNAADNNRQESSYPYDKDYSSDLSTLKSSSRSY